MRLGINMLYLIPGVVGGTQTYALGLLAGLADLDTDDEFIVYTNRECADLPLPDRPNFKRRVCPFHATNRAVRYAWEQVMLPVQAARDRVDVLHSLGYTGPVRSTTPHVLTLHDMNYIDIPGSVSGLRQRALRTLASRAARNADHVITISEFSKSRIIHNLHIDRARISVTYLASRELDARYTPDAAALAQTYGIRTPYIVAFSSPFPHKNILRLVDAFARIAATHPHSLVLVGHLPADNAIQQRVRELGLQDRVVTTSFVPDVDIMPLLQNAAAFAFPSVYEGFGLPVLDAQHGGVPVIASTAASIPEVAGDGARFFDPDSTGDMSAAIAGVLDDPALAADLVRRGHANVARFTWRATARATRRVYMAVAQAGAPTERA
jgi:glycosyltransferase involved in cell wall biosynthesis